jgi:hypothetical protein
VSVEFYVVLHHKKGFIVDAGGEVFAQAEDATRPSGTTFSLGGLALRRGKATLAPGKTKETRWIIVGGLAAPRLPPRSV